MGVGAIVNATAFVGGNYFVKYLTGGDSNSERKRHDLALEMYEKDWQVWQRNRQMVLDWNSQRRDKEEQAAQDMGNTDEALKLYNRVHQAVGQPQVHLKEPDFRNYYKPSDSQKTAEIVYVVGGMLIGTYLVRRFI